MLKTCVGSYSYGFCADGAHEKCLKSFDFFLGMPAQFKSFGKRGIFPCIAGHNGGKFLDIQSTIRFTLALGLRCRWG